jgi:hypothetical protein
MSNQRSRPGAFWYVVALVILASGVTWSAFGFVGDVKFAMSNALTRSVMPGTMQLQLTKAGQYTIYYEYQSVLNGEMFNTGESTDIQCTVQSPSGSKVPIQDANFGATYTIGSRAGKSLAAFSAAAPGSYALACAYPRGSGPRIVLAVGQDFAAVLALRFIRDGAILVGSFFLCALIIIVTLIRHLRH